MVKVVRLDLATIFVQRLKSLGINLQDSFPDKVLSFALLIVPNLVFNAPLTVVFLDDVSVGSQSSEDWHLVHLEFLQTHEEVVDVAVLSLHHNFSNDSG